MKVLRQDDEGVLDISEAALYLRTTERAVRGRIARRQLPHRQLGRRIYFLKHELNAFLEGLPGLSLAEARDMTESKMR